jgi:hypothetical protein
MKGRGLKLHNEYAAAFGCLYAKTPKAVFAAVAFSYAQRLTEDKAGAAVPEFLNEWRILNESGIVPQAPQKTGG